MVFRRRVLRRLTVLSAAGLLGLPLLADIASAAKRLASGGDDGCRIVNVIDGDTVTVWCGSGGIERARLTGFDTPEKFSPGCVSELLAAERATWALRWMVFSADKVAVVTEGRDRYDRLLAAMILDGTPLHRLMIRDGHARAYDGGRRGSWCA